MRWLVLLLLGTMSLSVVTSHQTHDSDLARPQTHNLTSKLFGMSVEYDSDKKRVEYLPDGTAAIQELTVLRLRLYGIFPKFFELKFSAVPNRCDHDDPTMGAIYKCESTGDPLYKRGKYSTGLVNVTLPVKEDHKLMYICLKDNESEEFVFQGVQSWLTIKLTTRIMPTWVHILLLILLLVLSGLFSGLNLGLMSLNKTDLKIIINTGTVAEKSYASKIAPVRNHGNFLLCCLLFSNVLVNATLTILVDELTTGIIAVVMSTLFIVIFGEIVPQAICSRHGLAVGAKTIYVTKFFMFITAPLAWPLSKVLDKILGEEIGSVYTRERLKELLKVTKDHHGLETEEVGIISGALDLKKKTVKDIMTNLDGVFMLPINAVLDYETMSEIEYHGYSRIPVYERERSNIVSLLNVKQLTLLDASDNIPLRTVIEYYQNQLFYVFENTRLDYMFRTFREGNRGHMAFVQNVNAEGPGDPYYETIGVVTMEDVLEELLQAEILDENDVGKLQARMNKQRRKEAPYNAHKRQKTNVDISPALALAAVQYLSTSIEPFKKDRVSVAIIQRLLKTTLIYVKSSKSKAHENQPAAIYLYEMGKPVDFFLMIIEGKVEVTVGKEKLLFEGGPFTTFGAEFLLNASDSADVASPVSTGTELVTITQESSIKKIAFIPDYNVKVLSDVCFMKLKYSAYRAAKLATILEKNYKDPDKAAANKNWEEEIEKVLGEVVDEDQHHTVIQFDEVNFNEGGCSRKSSRVVFDNPDGDIPTEETKLL